MHIPDGFLSPQTCAGCWAAAMPVWYGAWGRMKARFEATTAAHVGIAAAFVFLLQMVNVPIPGGTSGHAVGAALVAIALGPAAAVIAVSMALLLQAIVFGDGGILAYGANVITMAVVQAAVAWGVWRGVTRGGASERLSSVGAFLAGYVAAVAGAVVTGVLLGMQPHFFTDAAGAPLYFPLGLRVSVPAMTLSHLLIGVVEGGVTFGAIKILRGLPNFEIAKPVPVSLRGRVLAGVALMALIVPAGVLLPALMGSGEPWGEWSAEETARVAGHDEVPAGMARFAEWFRAPVPDYQFGAAEGVAGESAQYVGAAVLGVILTGLLCVPLHRLQQRRLARLRAKQG
jgi:cobalt/nickel transport system permease protein